jgi:restriction system protein
VDLVMSRGSDRYFVQCKQWKARQVGVATVRELYGVMAAKGAAGGYVVTSGAFTDEARRFADGREIELIEGDRLAKLIAEQSASSERSVSPRSSPLPAHGTRGPVDAVSEVPSCPQCGSIMVLRTARKGDNAGKSFWGCSTFPKCRETRPV